MARTFAYCRVSTVDQSTDNQKQELLAAGFAIEPRRILTETVSGSQAARQRPGFAKLLDRLESGDVLVVTKLDRLGRSATDVRSTVDLLVMMGVKVHCLALGGVDLTSPAGRMTMQVIVAVAEFELDLLKERTNAGLARARAEGKVFGRPSKTSAADKAAILARLDAGAAVSDVAREFGISRSTVVDIREPARARERYERRKPSNLESAHA